MTILLRASDLPYQVGALYNRREEIHELIGGQRQGGISTPAGAPFVIIFTGEAGKLHGYDDFWDDEGIFHYYGEGQSGDMQDKGGNRAIREHQSNGKRLLLFQMMGHAKPYRFLGELRFLHAYAQPNVPDTNGKLRTAIVFKLSPVDTDFNTSMKSVAERPDSLLDLLDTTSLQLKEVRLKQSLFKRRLLTVEKKCRLTGIVDLRFLRASHIKPWSKCASGDERVDGNNGLLLSPHADFLFDRGWITFDDDGSLIRSSSLPGDVVDGIGLDLKHGRKCGEFFIPQKTYLEFHRNAVFEKAFRNSEDPISELLATTAT